MHDIRVYKRKTINTFSCNKICSKGNILTAYVHQNKPCTYRSVLFWRHAILLIRSKDSRAVLSLELSINRFLVRKFLICWMERSSFSAMRFLLCCEQNLRFLCCWWALFVLIIIVFWFFTRFVRVGYIVGSKVAVLRVWFS